MKSEKGITLISLIIYMIAITIVIGILATVSSSFHNNIDYIKENSKYVSEYNKFNMYFVEDVKNNRSTYNVTENEIIFEDGTVYTYKSGTDKSIYRNKIKICENIAYCKFSKTEPITNGVLKHVINVHMIIEGSKIFETTNEYVLRYW